MSISILEETKILRKRIVLNQPKSGDVSQYTFNTDDSSVSLGYSDSTSLPKNNDKFQDKDLNITAVGYELNEKILQRNLKSATTSFIRIDKCFVEYVGTPTPLKDVRVKMWMMSDKFVQDNDESIYSYGELIDLVNVTTGNLADRIFEYEVGRLANEEDLGNLSFIEGINIFSNLSGSIDNLQQDDFSNKTDEYSPSTMLTTNNDSSTSINSILDEDNWNPIYMIFELTAHSSLDGTDKRDSRWQVFQINNIDLFNQVGSNYIGKQTKLTFEEMFIGEYYGNESGGGVEDSALKITDFQVTINTRVEQPNTWNDIEDEKLYKNYFSSVQPAITFNKSFYKDSGDKTTFLNLSPKSELDNQEEPGMSYLWRDDVNPSDNDYRERTEIFIDYFPKQHIGILNADTNQLTDDVYLDEYRDDKSEQIIALGSAPALISFDFEMVAPLRGTFSSRALEDLIPMTETYGEHTYDLANDYFYFVINWNDEDNEIKSIEEWLKVRPTTYRELLELQTNNLYSVVRHKQEKYSNFDFRIDTFGKRLSNTYTTPGIKTIKTIMFSYDEDTNQVGRWKLITSRFYLDIPLNQYPDFSQVGGDDYVTIPWPYTTPVIGGVSQDSKYKKSVQEALSSGNIGNTDIIDEKFLINDLENDELGNNIGTMDLEQVRFFNKSYDMNKLLNLVYNEEFLGQPIYLTSDEHLRTLPGYYGGGTITDDLPMSINELSWTPVGSSNPAFGEDGYLLTVYNYEELEEKWLTSTTEILQFLNDNFSYELNTSNWLYTVEEDLNSFIYDGYIAGETGQFVNDMAMTLYYLKTDYYPIIPPYEINDSDVEQWNQFGRPDIATYLTDVINGTVQLNPPIIDDNGNQTFGGGDGFGGGIEEGGIDGSEPHFEGGYPGGGEGGIDNPGGDANPDFPPNGARLNVDTNLNNTTLQSGNQITIIWEQVEDFTLNESSFYGGNYGYNTYPSGYYYTLAQDPFNEAAFPVYWNKVYIYLEKKVNSVYEEFIYIGQVGHPSSNAPNDWTDDDDFKKSFIYTLPRANELGLSADSLDEQYRIKIIAQTGDYTRTAVQSGGSMRINFIFEGGAEPSADADSLRPKKFFENPTYTTLQSDLPNPYNQTNIDGSPYWNGVNYKFPEESSVGQIFINSNQDGDLKHSCKLELNTGQLTGKSILDTSGNLNKGLLIGDYKVKKERKGEPMRRDSFIKVPKKTGNTKGAL